MAQNSNLLSDLNSGQRVVLAVALFAALGLGLMGYLWLYQTNYQPLYESLNEEDAANVVTQLQEMKVPYRLADGGKTVLVDQRQLQETKVMMDGGKLSIHGGEGFELFDDVDYGMTEFAQKINYQRALQGEISRTLIGLKEIKYARVHLVLPEKTLFQKATKLPKASITLVQEHEQQMSVSQVRGIQELVASAIEGMEPNQVTLLNEDGVVLSKSQYEDDHGLTSKLGQKQEMEQYLGAKTERILDQVFGAGTTVVNVDVSISYDQVQLTRESYTPSAKGSESGFLERSRVQRQYQEPGTESNSQKGKNPLYSETSEYDYKLGKNVEQVVKSTGSVERLMVSVMVPDTTGDQTLLALRQLVGNAVGLRPERGDSIQIFGLPVVEIQQLQHDIGPEVDTLDMPSQSRDSTVISSKTGMLSHWVDKLPLVAIGTLLVLLFFGLVYLLTQRGPAETARLSEEERRQLFAEVSAWMNADNTNVSEDS